VEEVQPQHIIEVIEPPPADEGYRTVSALAVLALVLGLLSAVAFAHPLLWALPAAAVGVAIAALRHIGQHPGEVIGRKAALLGMATAVLFGCAATSYSFAREIWLVNRSRQVADHFFSLLAAGKTHGAHQMTLMPMSRLPTESDLAAGYANNPESAKEFEKFSSGDVIVRIRQGDGGLSPRYQGGRLANLEALGEYIELDYLLDDGSLPDHIRVIVEFSRHPDTRAEQWRLAQIGTVE
jgi:hypothetical protein